MNIRKAGFLIVLIALVNTLGAQQKPNVLFITVDDLNDWIGAIGGHPDIKTPHMDKLAAEGVVFTNAYCQAPLCGPSRASVLTGLRPSTTGIYGMIKDDLIRTDNEETKDVIYLPEYFKNNGYYTMGVGKLWHEHAPKGILDESAGRIKGYSPLPKERINWDGIGLADENYGRTSTDWGRYPEHDSLMHDYIYADKAIEWLKKDYDEPFFLGVGFVSTHVPLYAPKKWFDLYDVNKIVMPPYKADDLDDIPKVGLKMNDLPMMPSTDWAIENDEWKNIVHAYMASISFVDHQIGRVYEALKNSKYANNTIIVLWSDHGYRLGEKGTFAKHCLWEEATNAPLIFAGAGIKGMDGISQPVEMLSIYATLLDLCGLPSYERNEGVSLAKLVLGDEPVENTIAITTHGMNNHSIRSDTYRYIRYEDGGEELYDHLSDPYEWNNLASDKNYSNVKAMLKKHLPDQNAKWNSHSSYKFQPYFVNQKTRTSNCE